jgi:hypothetical protein
MQESIYIDKLMEEIEETCNQYNNDEEMTQEQVIEGLQAQIDNIDKLEAIINEMRRQETFPGKPGDPINID